MLDWNPDELKSHLDSGAKVFLKLWKRGCGACKLSIPALERIVAVNTHNLIFAQINADDFPEILELAEAEALPAFFVFIDRKLTGQFTGFKGLEKLKSFIDASVHKD